MSNRNIVVLLCMLSLTVFLLGNAAGDDLRTSAIANGSFEEGLTGWTDSSRRIAGPPANPEIDSAEKYEGRHSLCIPGNKSKAGAFQVVEHIGKCSMVRAQWWVKAEKSPELQSRQALIGVDLSITLNSGKQVYHIPLGARVVAADAGKWVRKRSSFLVPPSDRIVKLTVFCINYDNSGKAWFDDVEVEFIDVKPCVEPVRLAMPLSEKGERIFKALQEAFKSSRIKYGVTALPSHLSKCRLLVLSDFPDEEETYRSVRDFFYGGGRVIGCEFEDSRFADGIREFIWGVKRPTTALATADGRARYFPDTDELLANAKEIVHQTLESDEAMPGTIEKLAFAERVDAEIRDSALWVDNKPCFLRAAGAYGVDVEECDSDFAQFAGMHLNGLVGYVNPDASLEDFVRFLDTAHRRGLLVIVWFRVPRQVEGSGGIPWKAEWLMKFLRCSEHPALLGWLISDDTNDEHYTVLNRIKEIIRRYDKNNFITATMFGFRYPERISNWDRWKALMDYPTTYDYPLNKDGKHFRANLCVGLEDIQRLCENVHEVYKRHVYFHLWAQSHMQTHVRRELGIGARDQFLASPEQMRLLTYMMISSGARGILYFFAEVFSEEYLGIGRRSELSLVWQELSPLEAFIAAGEREHLKTSRKDVEAVAFRREGECLILLTKHGENYHRCVSDGTVRDVTVTVGGKGLTGMKAWRVDLPAVMAASCRTVPGGMKVSPGDFDLTCLVLLTKDDGTIEMVRRYRNESLGAAAQNAWNVCRDKKVKTEVVLEEISRLGCTVSPETHKELEEARLQYRQAAEDLKRGKLEDAYTELRSNMEQWRGIQSAMMAAAKKEWDEAGRLADAEVHLNMYFSLPNFYSVMKTGKMLVPGELGRRIREQLQEVE